MTSRRKPIMELLQGRWWRAKAPDSGGRFMHGSLPPYFGDRRRRGMAAAFRALTIPNRVDDAVVGAVFDHVWEESKDAPKLPVKDWNKPLQ
jgi:hypothetical protein